MNGAESLVRTLTGGGVTVCFANPGTSEMHFVAALDRVPGLEHGHVIGLQVEAMGWANAIAEPARAES